MEAKELAKLIKDYRQKKGISQSDLADAVGLTQATVSRMEAGIQKPRAAQEMTILDFIGSSLRGEATTEINLRPQPAKDVTISSNLMFVEHYSNLHKNTWNYFWAERPQDASTGGDLIAIKELDRSSLSIMIADSVGHGSQSAYMSFALEMTFQTITSTASPHLVTPDYIDRSLAIGIANTGRSWRGEPSIGLINIDLQNGVIDIINRGLPYPLLLVGDKPREINQGRAAAYALNQISTPTKSHSDKIESGQSLLFFTDGLLDMIDIEDFRTQIAKLNRLFKGDSKAIGKNIIRLLQNSKVANSAKDDVSFFIISKNKKVRA